MNDLRSDEAPLDEQLLEALRDAASAATGFSHEAILGDALARSARELLHSCPRDELISRAHLRDAELCRALSQAVVVGETFFFRQPEHFRFIEEELVPRWLSRGARHIRAWSAGCATGEEAFSLAASLQQALADAHAPHVSIDVLGTDILHRNLLVAHAATYGAWSQRASAPLRAPLFRPVSAAPGAPPQVRVLDRVRDVVRFAGHNLLEPLPSGEETPFDLILCRNVLVYFSPEAARRALANLAAALADDGLLLLGSMDLNVAPLGLVREGTPESLIFRKRPPANEPALASPAPAADPLAAQPASVAPQSLVHQRLALHLQALHQLEKNQLPEAEQTLRALVVLAPDYLPGLFERALLHGRRGEPAAAASLMREVRRRALQLEPGAHVAGLETLDARFYVESAEAFLRGPGGGA